MSFFGVASGITRANPDALVVQFDQPSYLSSVIDSIPCNTQIWLDYDGSIYEDVNGGGDNLIGSWALPILSVAAVDYDLMWDDQGPDSPNMGLSPINTWLAGVGGAGSGGEWARWGAEDAGGGAVDMNGILRIRPSGGGADVTTADMQMTAQGF